MYCRQLTMHYRSSTLVQLPRVVKFARYASHQGASTAKIFQTQTPKEQALRLFKNELWLMANEKYPGSSNAQLREVVDILGQGRFPAGLGLKQIVREIYTLTLQHRITSDDMYNAIKQVRRKSSIVNVAMPTSAKTTKRTAVGKTPKTTGDHIPGDIHPQSNAELDTILQQILELRDSDSNELYQVLSNMIEESNESQKFVSEAAPGAKADTKDINIKTLEDYLKLISKRQQQREFVVKQQKKIYDWNRALEESSTAPHRQLDAIMSGSIRYGSAADATLGRVFKEIWKSLTSVEDSTASQYMLFNAKTNREALKTHSEVSHALMLLQKTDVINIANRASRDQKDIVTKLRELETQQWQPLGTILDAPDTIVLQKKVRKRFSTAFWTLVALTGVIIPVVYVKKRHTVEQQPDSIPSDTQS